MSYNGWVPAPQSNYGAGASAQPSPTNPHPAPPEHSGLDTWLLDKLFGRHF
jgi:hypothetical protein